MIEDDPERRAAAAEIATRMQLYALPDARFDMDLDWFIPSFAEADVATARLTALEGYGASRTIFVTPDNGLASFRADAIRAGKTLVLPTYGLRRGFIVLIGSSIDPKLSTYASWLDGLATFGRPISLDELAAQFRFDLVVTAASAISTSGQRFGMGARYLDLEYPILAALGTVDNETPIVALVHNAQIWPHALPPRATDVLADFLVTPSAAHELPRTARPAAINWGLINQDLQKEPYFAPFAKRL